MRTPRWLVLLAASALLLGLTACGDDDDDSVASDDTDETDETADDGASEPAGGSTSGSGFKACQVTDSGGIDDRSFNQTAYAGLEQADTELDAEITFLESQGEEDFATNIEQFLGEDCDLIVTVGFLLADATAEAAQANPDQRFAIVDNDFFDADAGQDITYDNVRELFFSTDEAAFLAGYLAAGMSESGSVGTFGGLNIPTVTIFMDGFRDGVLYHNEQKGTDVQVLGWDGSDGLFTGDFENQDNGRNTAQSLLDQGADIILPVAGPVGLGAAAAVQEAGDASMIWVDVDGCESAEQYCDLFLTSIEKRMDVAVFDTIEAAEGGSFEGGLYTGTLENEGVGIAPYNEFEDEVPEELKAEVEALQQQIIDGEVTVGE